MKNRIEEGIKRYAIAAVLAIGGVTMLNADEPPVSPEQETGIMIIVNMADCDEKPVFPGGEPAMYQWIAENIIYPVEAADAGAQGKVVLRFVVTDQGEITGIEILRGGRHPSLNDEAVRLVKSMPRWTPGIIDGIPVNVSYILPVTFKLKAR